VFGPTESTAQQLMMRVSHAGRFCASVNTERKINPDNSIRFFIVIVLSITLKIILEGKVKILKPDE